MPKRNLPYRKSIRLKGWDYRNPGLYFVTICTKDRQHHFGEIRDGIMGLSVPGCLAWHYWRQIPSHQSNVVLDEFVVMPNHLHGIVGIEFQEADSKDQPVGTLHATSPQDEDEVQDEMSSISPDAGSLSTIIRSYKSAITRWCNRNGHEYFAWQSRFYDHIIRNEKALHRIRKYILNNPLRWQIDRENPNSNEIHEQAVEYMAAKN
ncbi:transposase [Halalkalibaculum sp. DA384]|uniref:transposase n=1 Tax=Halalkalibaculum sp. DA384 TaxID=3373606 RepID=UPI0037543967